jgi:hypothetical protein
MRCGTFCFNRNWLFSILASHRVTGMADLINTSGWRKRGWRGATIDLRQAVFAAR